MRLTVPVGVACPLPPFTEIVTIMLCRLVIMPAEGVTVTVGAAVPIEGVTVTLDDCAAEVYALALEASGVYVAWSVSLPTGRAPAARLKVAKPFANVCSAL